MIRDQITRPTLVIDTERCQRNIQTMCTRMTAQGVAFRPHFKTHQSRAIGRWFRDHAVHQITVSSLGMAWYFAQDGWDDITVAFPVNLREMDTINTLAAGIRLNLLVEDPAVIAQLDASLTSPSGVFLKIDTGTHRTGLNPVDVGTIDACVDAIARSAHLTWRGFLAHAGHTYRIHKDPDAIQQIYRATLDPLVGLKARYQSAFRDMIISFGDTPGACLAQQYKPADEMRPGNFVFFDTMQVQIGSCTPDDIAVAMGCPVVAIHPGRQECIIYGGGIHFSKDILSHQDGSVSYGTVVGFADGSWDAKSILGEIRSLSQEHGVIRLREGVVESLRPGQLVYVLPVHSCMTAQCMGGYLSTSGARYDHYAAQSFK